MFYQDTDSNYNCMNVVRKWRERGLYGDKLGQFKNDTVKDGDRVGVLGYFLQRKLKIYFARDLGRGRWTRKVTAKGWAVKNIPPFAAMLLVIYQTISRGEKNGGMYTNI